MCGISRKYILYSLITRVRASAWLVDQIGWKWYTERAIVSRPTIIFAFVAQPILISNWTYSRNAIIKSTKKKLSTAKNSCQHQCDIGMKLPSFGLTHNKTSHMCHVFVYINSTQIERRSNKHSYFSLGVLFFSCVRVCCFSVSTNGQSRLIGLCVKCWTFSLLSAQCDM